MTLCKLFKLLLWKNYILKKRMFLSSLIEVLLPLLFAGLLISFRLKSKPQYKDSVRYNTFLIDDVPDDYAENFPPDFLWLFYLPSDSDAVKTITQKVAESFQFVLKVAAYSKENLRKDISFVIFSTIVFNNIFGNQSARLPLAVDYQLRFPFRQKFAVLDEPHELGEEMGGWNTHLLFPISVLSGPREPKAHDGGLPGYFREGFLSLQHAVDREIMYYHMNDSMAKQYEKVITVMKRFPYPAYMKDPFISILEENFSLLILLSFLCNSVSIIHAIVHEKEKKVKEYLRIMGLSNWMHWSVWFFMYMLFFIIVISIMTILFSLKVHYDLSVLTNSDPTLVFFFLLCFGISTISFSFMISVFFTKANLAVATGGIVYFLSYLPFFYISLNIFHMTHYMKLVCCLFSNVAMAFGVLFMVRLEGKGIGIQWKHVLKIYTSDKFDFGEVLIMLLLDSILYGLVTWYVEAVFPGKYGIPQPWYFFMMPSYWSASPHNVEKKEVKNDFNTSEKNPFIQDEPTNLVAGIRICNVSKVYKSKHTNKMAVKNLTMNMYEGQITVLLGPNGAGKTTTLSILTGTYFVLESLLHTLPKELFQRGAMMLYLVIQSPQRGQAPSLEQLLKEAYSLNGGISLKVKMLQELSLKGLPLHPGPSPVILVNIRALDPDGSGEESLIPPTSGEAYLSGYEISQNIMHIRKSLGLCPQHDILFDFMTVAEHLSFYVQLKGISDKDCSNEVNYILNILNLENKRNTISKSLSGGTKRKISIGIALIGGSKVVMLDEPTSGMDPVSRRATWDLLQNQKSNRTILLTTHFMDEADLLGDRIAIMAKGELQCCGSSLFLKQKYGAGYHMVMVKEQHCNIREIESLIHEHMPDASLESNIGAELSFILPKENVDRFKALFEELEERQTELGISSFGVSVTTMEEVFLRVSKQVDSRMNLQSIQLPSIRDQNNLKSKNIMDLAVSSKQTSIFSVQSSSKYKSHWQKFYAMFIKKVLFTWRNWKMMAAQTIIPLLCVIFIMELFKTNRGSKSLSILRLTLNQYGRTTVPFFISETSKLHPRLSDHISNTIQAEGHVPLKVIEPVEDFLMLKAEEESDTFDETFLMAMSFQDQGDQTVVTALFNNQAYHAAPMALSMVENILYKLFCGSMASITVTNKPDNPDVFAAYERLFQGPKGHLLSISVIFGMSFIVSSFAILAISDRVLRSKHIQFISGISPAHYWLSFLLWDLILIFFNSLLLLFLLKVRDEKAYIHKGHPEATILMLMLHGWSAIPCMYLLSFFFSSSASGCTKLIILNVITGIVPFIVINVIEQTELSLPKLNQTLDVIFHLLPNYDLAMAFSNMYYNYEIKYLCQLLEISKEKCKKIGHRLAHQENIFAWQSLGIGKYLTSMALSGCIFLMLLFFIETNFFWELKVFFRQIFEKERLKSPVHIKSSLIFKDEDVENEREKILNSLPELLQTTPLVTKELTKIYSHRKTPVLAVNRISLTVQKSECFGLLGFNGAGKTSTFKMLTGENFITSGDAFINGKSILKNLKTLRGQVGYCPQFDALLDYMTGREILTMYARIWGIPENQIKIHVKNMIQKLLLDTHADRLVRNYSGGNKRKLSAGVALMGNPSIVFLDEPSTGMDPVARRLLWNAVTETLQLGKAIVITSHSMEECEALCTRVAIMVNGQFKCLGSLQHLKSKYGSGYTLLAKIKGKTNEEEKMSLETFKTFVKETFPGSILEEEHQGMVHYHLPKENLRWSKVFGIMEEVKDKYKLDDYSVSQVSLEQVFLSFAHLQDLKDD